MWTFENLRTRSKVAWWDREDTGFQVRSLLGTSPLLPSWEATQSLSFLTCKVQL